MTTAARGNAWPLDLFPAVGGMGESNKACPAVHASPAMNGGARQPCEPRTDGCWDCPISSAAGQCGPMRFDQHGQIDHELPAPPCRNRGHNAIVDLCRDRIGRVDGLPARAGQSNGTAHQTLAVARQETLLHFEAGPRQGKGRGFSSVLQP